MRLEKRKGKFAEGKFTSALLTFLFHPSNRIWIIPCFISKGWVREHLPILIQANAEREMAASNRNDPRIRAFLHWFPTLVCRLRLSDMWQETMCKGEGDGLLIPSPPECLDTHIFIEAAITMTIWGNWTHMPSPCQTQYERLWTGARACLSPRICPCPCMSYWLPK